MSIAAFVFCLSVALVYGQTVPANFVPFGSSHGDTLAPESDDGYFGPVAFNFNFYGTEQTQLYVDNNGLITFGSGVSTFVPVGMSGVNFPAISPFWDDVYTYCGGQVWYGSRTDAATLAVLGAGLSWTPTHAFVATWYEVGYYAQCPATAQDTFQAVLVADDNGNSNVCFHYGTMNWVSSMDSGPGSVGFSAGDGHRYVQTPASLTPAVQYTTDFCTTVNAVTIVLPPPAPAPPAQTCGNGVIEGTEQCDGGDCCTSTCTFSTSVCRASAGACDVAETCSGSSSTCPADSFASSSQVCGTSSGLCDVAATCSGSAASCPANTPASSSVVCRPAANSCDIQESCDGSSLTCPADALSMTPSCFCSRQTFVGGEYAINFFCSPVTTGSFYECLQGPWAVLSSTMNCASGTSCGCFNGQECSCGGLETPCVTAGTVQSCPAGASF